MPLLTISGADAMANVKANPHASWPARGEIGSRLEPIARPGFTPSFRLVAGEKIFTIGSCFARNIEVLLEQQGFEIPTRAIIRSDPEFASIGQNILNNYGAPSILNEIRWALDPAHPFTEEQAFFEIYPGKFIDAHLNHALKPASIEVVRARRRAILNAYRAIGECRVVIITLGLAECWLDKLSGIYLNTAPRRSMIRAEPDRFELHVLSYDEVLDPIEQALALIRANGPDDLRVILTVSPVPLTSTFRADDVMAANCYSKSVLRTVAEAVTLRHDIVDYYPSYESVTLSERTHALQNDQVHPTDAVISINTSRMIRAYVGAGAMDVEGIRDAIAENPLAAISLLGDRPDLVEGDAELALALLTSAGRTGRIDLMELAVSHIGDFLPVAERNVALARIAMSHDKPAEALALLDHEPARRSARGSYLAVRLNAEIALGHLDAARSTVRMWCDAFPRAPEPFRLLAQAYARNAMPDDARSMFEAALALTDDDARTLLDYADFLIQLRRDDDARGLLDRVQPTNPSQTDRLTRLRQRAHAEISPVTAAHDNIFKADAA